MGTVERVATAVKAKDENCPRCRAPYGRVVLSLSEGAELRECMLNPTEEMLLRSFEAIAHSRHGCRTVYLVLCGQKFETDFVVARPVEDLRPKAEAKLAAIRDAIRREREEAEERVRVEAEEERIRKLGTRSTCENQACPLFLTTAPRHVVMPMCPACFGALRDHRADEVRPGVDWKALVKLAAIAPELLKLVKEERKSR